MVSAGEIKTQYASVSYEKDEMLQTFNKRLYMGGFRFLLNEKRPLTVEDEVKNKIDLVTVKAEEILEMFPPHLQYSMTLLENMDQVRDMFMKFHNLDWKRPGLYSPVNDTVYLSVKNSNLKVVAHEIGHVVVNKYFKVRPPVKIHELLAQFVESHIDD